MAWLTDADKHYLTVAAGYSAIGGSIGIADEMKITYRI